MVTVHYLFSIPYKDVPGAGLVPAVEVELHYGGQLARAVGVFDSGSTHTVFSVVHAETLGIDDVTQGELFRATTMSGKPVEYYLFDVEMALRIQEHPVRFPRRVGFFPVRSPRNILGRNLVFSRFEIGFKESGQRVQIRPEE